MSDKKPAKKAAKKAAPKKKAKEAPAKKAIGIAYVADALDLSTSAARNKLRDNNIPKTGKSYGWDTKEEANKVISKLTKKAA